MPKTDVKRKTFRNHVAQIWRSCGFEAIPVSLAVDSCKFPAEINLEELQKWREFRTRGNSAEADRRQATVEASLATLDSHFRDVQVQIEAASESGEQ